MALRVSVSKREIALKVSGAMLAIATLVLQPFSPLFIHDATAIEEPVEVKFQFDDPAATYYNPTSATEASKTHFVARASQGGLKGVRADIFTADRTTDLRVSMPCSHDPSRNYADCYVWSQDDYDKKLGTEGVYYVTVKAVSTLTNQEMRVWKKIIVDKTAPEVVSQQTVVNNPTADTKFTTSVDAGPSGVKQYSARIYTDQAMTSEVRVGSMPCYYDYTSRQTISCNIAKGIELLHDDTTYYVKYLATDGAGNQSFATSSIVMNLSPVVAFAPLDSSINPTEATLKLSDESGLSYALVNLYGDKNGKIDESKILAKVCEYKNLQDKVAERTCAIPQDLDEGKYWLKSNALDLKKNNSAPRAAYLAFTVDRTAPKLNPVESDTEQTSDTTPAVQTGNESQTTIIEQVVAAVATLGANWVTANNTQPVVAYQAEQVDLPEAPQQTPSPQAQTEQEDDAAAPAVLGATDESNGGGWGISIPVFWWIAAGLLAASSVAWWLIAGYRRRKEEENRQWLLSN